MSLLKPDRHELFAQGLAKGLTQNAAYAEAGYKPNRGGASRLASNVNIINRVNELKQRGAIKITLSKQFVLEAAIDNLEKARGLRPVKVGPADEAKSVYVYEGAVAN